MSRAVQLWKVWFDNISRPVIVGDATGASVAEIVMTARLGLERELEETSYPIGAAEAGQDATQKAANAELTRIERDVMVWLTQ